MKNDMKSVLSATGYLHQDQLREWYQAAPNALSDDPQYLWYRQACWDQQRFHQGRHPRHWALRTATYYHWAPYLEDWRIDAPKNTAVRPDALAWFLEDPGPIALEIDTAKENRGQWEEKLSLYATSPTAWRILVVAQGKTLRLNHLMSWLQASPRPWAVIPASQLVRKPQPSWVAPVLPQEFEPTPRHIEVQYSLDGLPIDALQAQSLLQSHQATIHGSERRSGILVRYLQSKKGKMIRPFHDRDQ